MSGLRIAVLGATGLVGQTILQVLSERQTPVTSLVPLATEGQGRHIQFQGQSIAVESVDTMDWSRVDVAFFAASNEASARYVPLAKAQGVTVIDKSSHFRMDPEVPLVVPEVNGAAIGQALLIASPNCSTIQMVVALAPIRQRYGLSRVLVSTYQAVSGTGRDAMTALEEETLRVSQGLTVTPSVYPTQIAHNALPYCDRFGDMDYTGEEWKLIRETRKIFDEPIPVSATAVRVPVYVGHSEAVYLETQKPFELDDVRRALAAAPSVELVDDPKTGRVPTPVEAAGKDTVMVGRVRRDIYAETGLHLFVVSDNLRKGAALNAVQILESVIHRWL